MSDPSRARTADSIASIDKIDHSKYGRSSRSRRRTFKIMALTVALTIALLVIIVGSIYGSVRIAALNENNRLLDRALDDSRRELETLRPELERAKSDLKLMVEKRFPNLKKLVANQVLEVDNDYIKNVVFTTIKQGKREHYKYLLVVENNGTTEIKPSFRVLLFNEFGVHVATDEKYDDVALNVGESRDYTAELDFFYDTPPAHFYINDLTSASKARN